MPIVVHGEEPGETKRTTIALAEAFAHYVATHFDVRIVGQAVHDQDVHIYGIERTPDEATLVLTMTLPTDRALEAGPADVEVAVRVNGAVVPARGFALVAAVTGSVATLHRVEAFPPGETAP